MILKKNKPNYCQIKNSIMKELVKYNIKQLGIIFALQNKGKKQILNKVKVLSLVMMMFLYSNISNKTSPIL